MAYLTNTFKKLMTVIGAGTPSTEQMGEMLQGTVILDLDGRLMTKDGAGNLRLIAEANNTPFYLFEDKTAMESFTGMKQGDFAEYSRGLGAGLYVYLNNIWKLVEEEEDKDALDFDLRIDIDQNSPDVEIDTDCDILYVDWGDGTIVEYLDNGDTLNILGTAKGTFQVLIKGKNVITFKFSQDTEITYAKMYRSSELLDAYKMFYKQNSMTSFDYVSGFEKTTHFRYAWYQCNSLTTFPSINTKNAINLANTWRHCTNLTEFPWINTEKAEVFLNTWYNCNSLTEFPEISTIKCKNFQAAWSRCSSLTKFPAVDTVAGTNFKYTWYNCTSMQCMISVNTLNATNTKNMFKNDNNLAYPNSSEQQQLENGDLNYINTDGCQ